MRVMNGQSLNVMNVRITMFKIIWWDNGQTSWSNRILRQLHIFIGRLEFGWDTPFNPYLYIHDKSALNCCGGMGTGCIHEEINGEMLAEKLNE